eukprot:CAMPEP_0179038916 /NCGR_PEP_ID=MMETSP0796-20121207/14879_1 /TAXON_ID=73915 /ORGANISM="Pyrodinium bahamense, Strain pbaha01" /LENGTH=497 /DNA_ID=CAMNT_0020735247 /DNA_START=79 /DNA_END=1572 /DNA_ORIENTATION=-
MEAHSDELHSDTMDPKASRALSRCRDLRIEKTKYLRSCTKEEGRHQGASAAKALRRRATPHRSARTVTRTVLAKGKLEMPADVPTISIDRGGKPAQRLRKPSVSPLLPSRRADAAAADDGDQEEAPEVPADVSGSPDCLEPSGAQEHAASGTAEVQSNAACRDTTPASHAEAAPHDAAIQALSKAMNMQDLAAPSASGLQHPVLSDPCSLRSAMDAGTVQRLLSAMQEHRHSAVAQEMACRLLGCIMSCGADFRTRVASCGGVKATLTAMAMHRSSAAVQEAGCHSLKGLAARSPTIQKDILSSSGIEAVLDAMKNHTCHATVQASGCGVLRNIGVGNVQHQLKIACLGGIQLVLAALAMHRMEADVQCAGCWALFCLSVQNRPVQAQAVTAGAVSCVLQAMKMHPAAAEVQEAGCWALKELVAIDGSDVGSWFDSVHAVSKALREVPSKGVQAAARAALQTLAKGSAMPCPPRTVEASNLKRRRFALSRDLTPIME